MRKSKLNTQWYNGSSRKFKEQNIEKIAKEYETAYLFCVISYKVFLETTF